MVDFYNKMKEIRINNGKSQKEIADQLRISQQQYSLYENGKRYIPVDLLKDFCEIMDCSADYILGIERREKSKLQSKSNCTKYTFLYSYEYRDAWAHIFAQASLIKRTPWLYFVQPGSSFIITNHPSIYT